MCNSIYEWKYDESFESLSEEEAHRRFGQFDHVRRFGSNDINSHLGKLINIPEYFDATEDFSADELLAANIPNEHWKGFQGSTVLNLARTDMRFLNYSENVASMNQSLPAKFNVLTRFFQR